MGRWTTIQQAARVPDMPLSIAVSSRYRYGQRYAEFEPGALDRFDGIQGAEAGSRWPLPEIRATNLPSGLAPACWGEGCGKSQPGVPASRGSVAAILAAGAERFHPARPSWANPEAIASDQPAADTAETAGIIIQTLAARY